MTRGEMEEYYAPEISYLKTRGGGIHFYMEIDDDGATTTTSDEFPGFKAEGCQNIGDMYFALCEWVRSSDLITT